MILTPEQQQQLLKLIQRNHIGFIASSLGTAFLSNDDVKLLEDYGINAFQLYNTYSDKLLASFHLGQLAAALRNESNNIHLKDFQQYLKNNPLQLTKREEYVLDSVKRQALSDIKGIGSKIFQDVTNVLNENSRINQEQLIRNEIITGTEKKQSIRNISNEIASKTGDWSRNFDRIVEYVSNTAFQEGKAEYLIKTYGDDVLVWKRVYNSACKHCIKLYLTNGLGSKPIVFTLSQLRANGTNIGRKTSEWKAVVGSTHPYCRCSLNYHDPAYDWNEATQEFDILIEKHIPRVRRTSKVIVKMGDKTYEV